MPLSVVPYRVEAFNRISSLHESHRAFEQRRGIDPVLGACRQTLVHCEMTHEFRVQLLHQHFALIPGEKLVEVDNESASWSAEMCARSPVVARSWALVRDGLMPYEFTLQDEGCVVLRDEVHAAFLNDISSVIRRAGLDDVLGLTLRMEESAGVEVTQGRRNIFRLSDEHLHSIAAVWYFNGPVERVPFELEGRVLGVVDSQCRGGGASAKVSRQGEDESQQSEEPPKPRPTTPPPKPIHPPMVIDTASI